jgi:ABC-type transport system substrate-binding protein
VNWSLLDNKEINDAMTEASLAPAGDERSQAWADVNKMIVEQAVAIPYVWDDNITLWSKDVEGAMNAYFSGPDFSFTTVK